MPFRHGQTDRQTGRQTDRLFSKANICISFSFWQMLERKKKNEQKVSLEIPTTYPPNNRHWLPQTCFISAPQAATTTPFLCKHKSLCAKKRMGKDLLSFYGSVLPTGPRPPDLAGSCWCLRSFKTCAPPGCFRGSVGEVQKHRVSLLG